MGYGMSVLARDWAYGRRAVTNPARAVLCRMADVAADNDPHCWLSARSLADDCGLSALTVKRCLTALRDAGYIEPDGHGEHSQVVSYRLRIDLDLAEPVCLTKYRGPQTSTPRVPVTGTPRVPVSQDQYPTGTGTSTPRVPVSGDAETQTGTRGNETGTRGNTPPTPPYKDQPEERSKIEDPAPTSRRRSYLPAAAVKRENGYTLDLDDAGREEARICLRDLADLHRAGEAKAVHLVQLVALRVATRGYRVELTDVKRLCGQARTVADSAGGFDAAWATYADAELDAFCCQQALETLLTPRWLTKLVNASRSARNGNGLAPAAPLSPEDDIAELCRARRAADPTRAERLKALLEGSNG